MSLLGIQSPNVALQIGGSLLVLLYFALFESSPWQATPGQKCLRMKICTLSYERISFGRALYRQVVKFILLFPLFLAMIVEAVILIIFLFHFFTEPLAILITMGILLFSGFLGSLFLYYVRLFNKGQQTPRDHYSKTLMILDQKT